MNLVTVKNKFQVVIPQKVRDRLPLQVGDVLEAKVERGKITLTPKSVIDRDMDEAIQEMESGQGRGPYATAGELLRSLRAEARVLRSPKRRAKR